MRSATSISRRQFLVLQPVAPGPPAADPDFDRGAARHASDAPAFRPNPPGLSRAAACTGCGLCAEACPTGIIALDPATPGAGPWLDFHAGECLFCGACARSCPEPVFDTDAGGAESPPMAHRIAVAETCLTFAGIACLTCADACPEQAIRFPPRAGGAFRPRIDPAACTGCGACVAPCPAGALTAVPLVAAAGPAPGPAPREAAHG